ncbi:hypothetical protein CB197_004527, partial [Salmonella enterica subsp. arizonae]|nr:hypothetical protein [Salmonella enterica subsp. arizonae]
YRTTPQKKPVHAAQSEPSRQLNYTFHNIKAKAISDFEGLICLVTYILCSSSPVQTTVPPWT